jgi:hypothetical protein
MSVCQQITNVVMRGLGLWGRDGDGTPEAPTRHTHKAVLDGADAVAAALVDRLSEQACRTIRDTSAPEQSARGTTAATFWLGARTARGVAISRLANSPHPAGRGAALALSLLSPAVDEAAKNHLYHKTLRANG